MGTSNANTKLEIPNTRRNLKRDQELENPCFKEYNLSFKCLEKTYYNYDKCEAYFENYRSCKKFWANIVSYRRSNNITPYIPSPEERESIKTKYLKSQVE